MQAMGSWPPIGRYQTGPPAVTLDRDRAGATLKSGTPMEGRKVGPGSYWTGRVEVKLLLAKTAMVRRPCSTREKSIILYLPDRLTDW